MCCEGCDQSDPFTEHPVQTHAQEKRTLPLATRSTPRTVSKKNFSGWITDLLSTTSQAVARCRYLARPVIHFHETIQLRRFTTSLIATYEHQEFRFDPFERKAGMPTNERVGLRPSPVAEERYRYIRLGVRIRALLIDEVTVEFSMASALILSLGSQLGANESLPLLPAADLSIAVGLNYMLSTNSELWGAMFVQGAVWSTSTLLDPSIADIALQRSLAGSAGIRWKIE